MERFHEVYFEKKKKHPKGYTIAPIIITCSTFFSQQSMSDYITVGVAARNYFQIQLQPRLLHGIIFQFWLQPRSWPGKTVSNDNIR